MQAFSVLGIGAIVLLRQDPTATPALVFALAPISFGLAVFTSRLLASYAQTAETTLGKRLRREAEVADIGHRIGPPRPLPPSARSQCRSAGCRNRKLRLC